MLAMGKMKPLSSSVGSSVDSTATWEAIIWLRVTTLMRSPWASMASRKRLLTPNSSASDPRTGRPKSATPTVSTRSTCTRPSTK